LVYIIFFLNALQFSHQDRSIVISTYALCGFANIGSIGTVMGALGAMAPTRKDVISSLAVRAMIAGNVVSFMNACTAGRLTLNTLQFFK
jgi:nucleoside permease NupC